jgi:hypothetical protein
MKEKIDLFKTIWSNKRYKAIIELSIYILFFIIIIIVSKVMGTGSEIKKTQNTLEDKYPYYFKTTINEEEIIGTIYEDKIEINYNDITYYYTNGIITPEQFTYPLILPYIDYYKVKENELYSKTEYNDGLLEETYIINGQKIIITTKDETILTIEDNQNKYYIYYSK